MANLNKTIKLSDIRDKPLIIDITAKESELDALASRFKIDSVNNLTAKVKCKKWRDGIEISGSFQATINQKCVITLESFAEEIKEEFTVYMLPHPSEENLDQLPSKTVACKDNKQIEQYNIFEDIDYLDNNDCVDISEIISEYLSLAIPDYPKKSGVSFKNLQNDENSIEKNPFAALKKLKLKHK